MIAEIKKQMKNFQNLAFFIGNVSKECKTTLHPEPNRSLLSYGYAFISLPALFFVKFAYFLSAFILYLSSLLFSKYLSDIPTLYSKGKYTLRYTNLSAYV